jgi:beta-glucanase (GH16 family)
MKKLRYIAMAVLISGCAITKDITNVELVKYDDFDGTGNMIWGAGEPWGNYHPRYLNNHWVEPVITEGNAYFFPQYDPLNTPDGIIPYSTGKMYSFYKQKYGYWEAKVLINPGERMRSAFWMYGGSDQQYREIDVFEYDGTERSQKINLHYGKRVNSKSQQIGPINKKTLLPSEWRVYGFLWTPDKMEWYVDGKVVKRLTKKCILDWFADSDVEVRVLLSQDVLGPLPLLQGSMIVDYVHICELK